MRATKVLLLLSGLLTVGMGSASADVITIYAAVVNNTGPKASFLYSIDPTTLVATNLGQIESGGNPVSSIAALVVASKGTIYGVSSGTPTTSAALYNITTPGSSTLIGSLGLNNVNATSLTFSGGTLYGVLGGTNTFNLYSINTSTGAATTPPRQSVLRRSLPRPSATPSAAMSWLIDLALPSPAFISPAALPS